ncbi:MAG: hypothetical protein C6W57_10145 [Caldibacillus debilis]|nr:MAG: hypothetical protein C6W57_10145 [Caldibacillus debilis]
MFGISLFFHKRANAAEKKGGALFRDLSFRSGIWQRKNRTDPEKTFPPNLRHGARALPVKKQFPSFLRFYDHFPAAEGKTGSPSQKRRMEHPFFHSWRISSSGKEPGRFPSPQEERAAGSFPVCMLPICHFAKR